MNKLKSTVNKISIIIFIVSICFSVAVPAKTDYVISARDIDNLPLFIKLNDDTAKGFSFDPVHTAVMSFEREFANGIQPRVEVQQNLEIDRLNVLPDNIHTSKREVFWMTVSGMMALLMVFCLCLYFYFKRKASAYNRQHENLAQASYFNNLSNRIHLEGCFTRAIAHSTQNKSHLFVCFVDLDGLEQVNDNYGYRTGDLLLVEVAARIEANLSENDTVSRQRGDEFVLLLSDNISATHCEQILDDIIQSIGQPFLINDQLLTVGISIGVSLYSSVDNDLDTLIAYADQAMYQAKLEGRNRYELFSSVSNKLNSQDIKKHIQFQEIHKAFLEHQFCLYYQPKTNMTTGKVFGVEALIRWIHPEKGLILPLVFLPTIEGTKLEIEIGQWVVNEGLRQLDLWRKQGFVLEMSLNISPFHLQSHAFASELGATLDLYPDLDSRNIQLEILETTALGDINDISSIISNCVDTLGVTIALDDFGTGYSSLTHLRHLPVHTIKIDQTFVKDVLADPNDYSIVDGVITLASSFNRKVIAEGIETPEQGLMLLIMGCDEAQGYEISPPIPASEVVDWLNNYIPNQQWIDCCNKAYTQREKKLVLFRLALSQWQTLFEHHLQFPPGNTQYWPIMSKKECLCGYWIKRMRQEQELLFEERWLERLEQAYEYIHCISNDLYDKYQKGKFGAAKDGLIDIRRAFDKMDNVLQQCE